MNSRTLTDMKVKVDENGNPEIACFTRDIERYLTVVLQMHIYTMRVKCMNICSKTFNWDVVLCFPWYHLLWMAFLFWVQIVVNWTNIMYSRGSNFVLIGFSSKFIQKIAISLLVHVLEFVDRTLYESFENCYPTKITTSTVYQNTFVHTPVTFCRVLVIAPTQGSGRLFRFILALGLPEDSGLHDCRADLLQSYFQ